MMHNECYERRNFLRAASDALLAICAFVMLLISLFALPINSLHAQTTTAAQTQSAREKALRLLSETPLVDGHIDLPNKIQEYYGNRLDRVDLASDLGKIALAMPFQTDIPRLRRGHAGGVFFVAYVGYEEPNPVPALFEQIDLIRRMVDRYPKDFALALTADDVMRIHRSGKIAVLIGMENGYGIGNSLAVLRQAYQCGARYLTLTHVKTIGWADASDWDAFFTNQSLHDGLTPFGNEVVREMNRLGMMVDLSHVSDKTALDALKCSEAPVMFSHSSARALCNHPRNVPDDILRLLKKNDGIIMLNFTSYFISEEVRIANIPADVEWKRLSNLYPGDRKRLENEYTAWAASRKFPKATISQLADHVDHIRKVAGIEHVGIGSDFDGTDDTPVGLENVSGYPELIIELLRRNYSPADIAKVASGNILRVMRSVECISLRLKQQRPASEALISELDKQQSIKHE
jgi:membrane dipeptidase